MLLIETLAWYLISSTDEHNLNVRYGADNSLAKAAANQLLSSHWLENQRVTHQLVHANHTFALVSVFGENSS
jgi:hypothetical protein